MTQRSRTFLSVALFIALGLLGAFIVSAVAGWWDDEPAGTGLQAVGWGVEDPGSVRVEVLNGAGTAGLAREATHHLRSHGFDVVFFGNAGRFDHVHSAVIDRTGDMAPARAVAAALGVDSVSTLVDTSLMLDVTVVLGRDWPPEPEPERHWTDRVRELLRRDTVGATDTADADAGPDATPGPWD